MIPKRVKQFYVNVTDKMTEKDYDYANEILNKKELELFMKLSKSEQKHSIRIAKDIEFIIDNNETDDEEILKNRKLKFIANYVLSRICSGIFISKDRYFDISKYLSYC